MTAWVKKCFDRAEDFRLAPKTRHLRVYDLQHESHGCLSVAAADRKQPADLDSASRLRAPMGPCRSRTNADDRLPLASLGRVQGGAGIPEGAQFPDVRRPPPLPPPPDH